MFNQLLGWFSSSQQENQATEGVENRRNSRLTTSNAPEDGWILIDCRDRDQDSEGNSECCSEDLNVHVDDHYDSIVVVEESADRRTVRTRLPMSTQALLACTNSTISLPASSSSMEESWFLTPPPCFSSTGPVHMETSPLEDLLIEHPSMSVYRHPKVIHHLATSLNYEDDVDEIDEEEEEFDEEGIEEARAIAESLRNEPEIIIEEEVVVVHRNPRTNRVHVIQQQERQGLQSKQAQKVQIQKACKAFKRGNLDRNNKAREVNCRNRRQRRGERSVGAKRSFANNNRKC